MANCMIGFPNNIDLAALSEGSYAATLPLAKVQTRRLKEVARTINTAEANTKIKIDQGAPRNTRVVAVVGHNLSVEAKYRVRATNEASATNLLTYSEGTVAQLGYSEQVSNAITSLPGFANAIQFGSNAVARSAYHAFSTVIGTTYTMSLFVQMDDNAAPIVVTSSAAGNGGDMMMVLQSDVWVSPSTVTQVGVGLYRILVSFVATTTGINYGVVKFATNSARGFRVTGYQLETGTAATSYFPTAAAAATRPVGYMDDWQSYTYDSGWLDVWPVVYPYGTTAWEDPSWFGGKYSAEQLAGYTATLTHLLPFNVLHRYWKINFSDVANAAGYVQFGRVFIGAVWQPDVNMSWGESLAWETKTDVQESLGGSESFNVKTPYRVERFKLGSLSRDEAMSNVFEIQRRAGIDKEIFWIQDPADTVHALRTRFLGRLRTLSAIEYPYYQTNTTAFEIKELQ